MKRWAQYSSFTPKNTVLNIYLGGGGGGGGGVCVCVDRERGGGRERTGWEKERNKAQGVFMD